MFSPKRPTVSLWQAPVLPVLAQHIGAAFVHWRRQRGMGEWRVGRSLVAMLLVSLVVLTFGTRQPAAMRDISASPVTTVSAASYEAGAIAPDSIVAAYGTGLSTQTVIGTDSDLATPGVQLPTQLGGTTVEVNGQRARLFFVAPTQINYLVPSDTPEGTVNVVIRNADGLVSSGTMNVRAAAPALFAANGTGSGVAAATILRIKANGQQLYEDLYQYSTTLKRFVTKPVDLGPSNEQVFLVLFGSGIRYAGTPGSQSNVRDSVRVLIGGEQLTPLFAGPQPGLVGLDQINVQIPRTMIGRGIVSVSALVNGTSASNLVDIEVAGVVGPTPPQISGFSVPRALAGTQLQINGSGFATQAAANVVKFGNAEAYVMSATPTQLTVVVPYGVETSQVSVTTPQGGTGMSTSVLPVRTSVSGIVASTASQPLKDVVVKLDLASTTIQTRTSAEGAFVLPDIPLPEGASVENFSLVIDGSVVPVSPPYPAVPRKILVTRERDNQFPSTIFIQQSTGTGGTIGGSSSFVDDPDVPPAGVGSLTTQDENVTTIQTDNFSLVVPNTIRALFPGNATSGTIFVTPVQNGRTPGGLPKGFYSSSIVQLTPFGVQMTPGAKLILPNTERQPAGRKLTLFGYDLAKSEFVALPDANAVVSADGQRIETGNNDIKLTTFYFAAAPATQKTDLTGRVLCCMSESGSTTDAKPVAKATVRLRGIEAVTDGNGSYLLRGVPVASGESVKVDVSLLRASGRVDQESSAAVQVVADGITKVPDVVMPAEVNNRAPVILAGSKTTVEAGSQKVVYLVIFDPDVRQNVTVTLDGSAASWAKLERISSQLTDVSYQLTLSPSLAERGNRELRIIASDGITSTVFNMQIVVNSQNRPPTANAADVTTDEDTPVAIRLTGSDPEGNTLRYIITRAPQNGGLTGTAPNLTYVPTANFNGTDLLSFRVNDGQADSNVVNVRITVRPVNDAPTLTVPATLTVNEGQPLSFEVLATDVESEQRLTITATDLPTGAKLDVNAALVAGPQATAEFYWTPSFTQAGNYRILLRATDSGQPALSDTKEVRITVLDVPGLSVPDAQTVLEGQTLAFDVVTPLAEGGNTVAVSSSNLPAGARLTQVSAGVYQFRWTPTLLQAGVYTVTFTLQSGSTTVTRDVRITVIDVARSLAQESADFTIWGATGRSTGDPGDALGTGVATGDLNGDGISDLVVGAPAANGDLQDAGAVYVMYGKVGLQGNLDLAKQTPDLVIAGEKAFDAFGTSLAIGDVTGDGKADLVVGAPLADVTDRKDCGKFYVLPAPFVLGGLPTDRPILVNRLAVFTANGIKANDWLGTSIAVGMLNGRTGAADLAVSAPGFDYSAASINFTDAGMIYCFWGSGTLGGYRDLAQTTADYSVYGVDAGGQIGSSLAIGNFNGDAFGDLAIGSPLVNSLPTKDVGAVYLVLGGAALNGSAAVFPATNVMYMFGASENDRFGTSVAFGDWNADGLADLAVGVPGGDGTGNSRPNAGEVFVLLGASSGQPKTISIVGTTPRNSAKPDALGTTVAFGDYNNDGIVDLLMGAPGYTTSSTSEPLGAAYLLFGAKTGLSSSLDLLQRSPDLTIFGAEPGDQLGSGGVAFANLNKDEATDLILGLPRAASLNNERPEAGEVRILYGVKR